MKLASRVILVAVAISVFCLTAFSQVDLSRKSDKDPRNEAPTVGSGGSPGGATGLFVTFDGKTTIVFDGFLDHHPLIPTFGGTFTSIP